MEKQKDASVSIWVNDGYEDISFGMTFVEADGLTMPQFLEACRRAAIAYGFAYETVDKYLPEREYN